MQSGRDRVGPTLGLPTSLLQEIEERVWRGAELLDRKRPGWFERIDLATLDLSSCENCIIGQEVGYYISSEAIAFTKAECGADPADLGFENCAEDPRHWRAIWSYLDACWADAVNERRATA